MKLITCTFLWGVLSTIILNGIFGYTLTNTLHWKKVEDTPFCKIGKYEVFITSFFRKTLIAEVPAEINKLDLRKINKSFLFTKKGSLTMRAVSVGGLKGPLSTPLSITLVKSKYLEAIENLVFKTRIFQKNDSDEEKIGKNGEKHNFNHFDMRRRHT